MTALRVLTDADFAAATGGGWVLVSFTASYCRASPKAAVEVAGLAEDLRIPALVMTADIDAAPQAADRADVRGVPCLVVFRDGVRVDAKLGNYPRTKLREWVENLVKS